MRTRNGAVRTTPEPVTVSRPMPPATPPIESTGLHGVQALMVASLPSQASGADVYARQFYRGSTVPYRRYLPISVE
jgi:hypothetical protein